MIYHKARTKMVIGLFLFLLMSSVQAIAANFTDNGDGTVTDSDTGLMWQQGDDGIEKKWQVALSHCDGLSLAGKADWRLPDIKELRSIVDNTKYDPAIDRTYFPDTNSTYYASSTTVANNASFAWNVNFGFGSATSPINKAYNGYRYVRCVR